MVDLSRRALLIGSGAVFLGLSGCSAPSQQPVPVAGEDNLPGEPLWSSASNAFLIGLTDELERDLLAWSPPLLTMGAERVFALENQCTVDTEERTTIAWCRGSQSFGCGICGSAWSVIGKPLAVATQGLTALKVSVNTSGEVTIERERRRAAPKIAPQPDDAPSCAQPVFQVTRES
jgi:hypothetical protein